MYQARALASMRAALQAALTTRAVRVQEDVVTPDGALSSLARDAVTEVEHAVDQLIQAGTVVSQEALEAKCVGFVRDLVALVPLVIYEVAVSCEGARCAST
jgi:hypothetical protein